MDTPRGTSSRPSPSTVEGDGLLEKGGSVGHGVEHEDVLPLHELCLQGHGPAVVRTVTDGVTQNTLVVFVNITISG